ncbi:MAG: hypothetical protein EHM15_08315 [Desulfobacteraceae bacterium]|nr:MAG: hypothetical protein EHM15_08315 [Desulfobacteraceae bacterium]
MTNNWPHGLVLGLMAMAGLILGACATAHVGAIKGSQEVTRDFEELRLNPDFRYWYYNLENAPYGVVGLEPNYRLDDSPLWQPVAPDSAVLRKVVGLVGSFPVPGSYSSGFHITEPQGRIIGVWYSSLPAGIMVDPATQRVSISVFMPWILNDEF